MSLNIRSKDLELSSLLRSPPFPFPWTEGPECSHMNLKQKLRGYLTAVGLLFSFVYDRTCSQMLRTDKKRAINLSRGPTVEKVAFVFDELIYCLTADPIPRSLWVFTSPILLSSPLGTCLAHACCSELSCTSFGLKTQFLLVFPSKGSHQWTYGLGKVLITEMK